MGADAGSGDRGPAALCDGLSADRSGRVTVSPLGARGNARADSVPWPAAGYQVFVAIVRCRKGFWQDANDLTEAARHYQRAGRYWICRALIRPFSFWSARPII
ncbi:hypothetical protein AWV80_06120 [Cupriavidus sp. UYMU48A]|nr:hypothetical protein AWV80_06120 [Cupriavidus sp. UYMU48A]